MGNNNSAAMRLQKYEMFEMFLKGLKKTQHIQSFVCEFSIKFGVDIKRTFFWAN